MADMADITVPLSTFIHDYSLRPLRDHTARNLTSLTKVQPTDLSSWHHPRYELVADPRGLDTAASWLGDHMDLDVRVPSPERKYRDWGSGGMGSLREVTGEGQVHTEVKKTLLNVSLRL